ncbi:MAG: helix-turn-helix domain-containing protein [Nannocystales bacterium]
MSPTDTPAEFLTVSEVAKLLRVERKTIYEAIRRDQLPGVIRLGRAIRIHAATLRAHLSGEARPHDDPPGPLISSCGADGLRPTKE